MDLSSYIDITRAVTEGIKVWLLGGGILLAILWRFLPRKGATIALAALTVVATVNYARWGPRLVAEQVDNYDLIHYYLNARYFDELGYYDLYPACMLADHENGGPRFDEGRQYMAQNDAGHGFMPIGHALARGEEVREQKFTPERWRAFEHDFLVLQREIPGMSDSLWRQMIQDHGYNGTPTWTVIARPLTEMVPVESVKWLGFIDLALLGVATAAVAWAYGPTAALWAWFFLMTSYAVRWPTITWALLRYDYVAALMIGMSLIKRRWHFLGGLFTAWAAASRLFPALWMFGPGAKGGVNLLGKRVDKRLLVLAGGFLVGIAVLEGVTIATLGTGPIAVHFDNMEDHNSPEQLSSRRVGLALALPFRGELNPKNIEKERKELIAAQKPLRFALSGVVMLVLGFGLRKARDDEAFAMGFIPFFLLTTASYYYYVTRVTLFAMHAGNLKRWRNLVGLVILLGVELFSNWAETRHGGHRVFLIGGMAWGMAAYTLIMTVWFLVESFRGGSEQDVSDRPAPPARRRGR